MQHVERLTAQGHMQAADMAHVEAARSDGRWATAYADSATMVMPEDFLATLQLDPAAHAFHATLKRQRLFITCHLPHSVKRPESKLKRHDQLSGLHSSTKKPF